MSHSNKDFTIERPAISAESWVEVIQMVKVHLQTSIARHGDGIFASLIELRGILDEEMDEVKEAMHKGDFEATVHELKDLAVGCLFGLASIIERRKNL